MEAEALWFLLVGTLLVAIALGRGLVARLPLSGAMVYLVVRFLIGPARANLLPVSLDSDLRTLRVVAETGLVVSLMAIGMHLRLPLSDPLCRLPLRLGFPAMLRQRAHERQATTRRGTPNATSLLPATSTGAYRASLSRQPAHSARRARSSKLVGRASSHPTNRRSR